MYRLNVDGSGMYYLEWFNPISNRWQVMRTLGSNRGEFGDRTVRVPWNASDAIICEPIFKEEEKLQEEEIGQHQTPTPCEESLWTKMQRWFWGWRYGNN